MMRPKSQIATCRNLSVSEKRHCFSNIPLFSPVNVNTTSPEEKCKAILIERIRDKRNLV